MGVCYLSDFSWKSNLRYLACAFRGGKMTIHQVRCDYCKKVEPLKWNGEHWLVQANWFQFYNDAQACTVNVHSCPDCVPKQKKAKKK